MEYAKTMMASVSFYHSALQPALSESAACNPDLSPVHTHLRTPGRHIISSVYGTTSSHQALLAARPGASAKPQNQQTTDKHDFEETQAQYIHGYYHIFANRRDGLTGNNSTP